MKRRSQSCPDTPPSSTPLELPTKTIGGMS
jgi:hypothetical protein